jgi:hypothetical protein
MIETLVIGKVRKTGKDEILADRTVDYARQKEIYESHALVSDKYETVALVSLEPVKRVFSPAKPTNKTQNPTPTQNEKA